MKTLIKTTLAGAAACALAAPAFAYTLNGSIDHGPAQIHLQQPIPKTGYVKLTVTIPNVKISGIPYSVGFCVGPTSNCFQISPSIPGGQQITVIYDAATLAAYGIWLDKGTAAPVPYTVNVDYLP